MSAGGDPTTRPWRIRGYEAGDNKKMRHQSTCRGDAALDEALKKLERDTTIGRITVEQA